MPSKTMHEPTEREKQIAQLKEQIEKAERRGHFDTAHHDMLKQLTQPAPKELE